MEVTSLLKLWSVLLLALFAAILCVGAPAQAARKPLAGKVVVIDPGHHLGNSHHLAQINKLVPAGFGLRKACNTTGTSTNSGYAEARFTLGVALQVRKQLRALGATVILTRSTNNVKYWGPCVNVRGQIGNAGYRGLKKAADVKLSIHADGAASADHGYHLIVASKKQQYANSDLFARDLRYRLGQLRFGRSNYIGTKSRGVVHRGDLGTLNLSRIPTVMIEAGNMRNANDAKAMVSTGGQKRYATALRRAIADFLLR